MKFLFLLVLFSFASFAQIYRHNPDDVSKWIGSYDEAVRLNKRPQLWTNDEWNGYFLSYPNPISFTKQQQDIVFDYKATAYKGINEALRTENPALLTKFSKYIHAIDAFINTFKPIPVPVIVYRGESRTIFKNGQYCLYKSYTSTTTSKKRAEMFGLGGTYMTIQLPSRLKALRMSVVLPISDREEEFVLPRNAWIRITGVKTEPLENAVFPMKVTAQFGVKPPASCDMDPTTLCCR